MVDAEGVSQASAPTLSEMLRTATVADDSSAIGARRTNDIGGSAAAPMRRDEERGETLNCRRLLGTECAAALWTEPRRLAREALEGFVASIVKPTRRGHKRAKTRCVSTLNRSPLGPQRNVRYRMKDVLVASLEASEHAATEYDHQIASQHAEAEAANVAQEEQHVVGEQIVPLGEK